MRGRVGKARTIRQVGRAQLVVAEQQGRQQPRLTMRSKDRRKERSLGSHITDIILHYIAD